MTDQTCANARDLLPALVREELTGEERALVEAHVSSCSSCTDELALIRRLSGAVQKMPAGLASEIKEAVARDRTQKRRTIGWQLPAAAMIVLALGTSLVWQRTQTLPETSQLAQESFVMVWADGDALVADAPMLEDLSEEELAVLLEELGG
jgi:anti-sigma factor RsiW